jgi:murein DD-endopeptidase MepM/ murein hydrolase activator NlpD
MTKLRSPIGIFVLLLMFCSGAIAQELYKYQDENGDWIYSDRPPDDGQEVEARELEVTQSEDAVLVDVSHSLLGRTILLTAQNDFFAPVEIRLNITESEQIELPDPDHPMAWILPPRSETNLLQLSLAANATEPSLAYEFRHLPGDPRAVHDAEYLYRAPFVRGSDHQVTQAYPDTVTHTGSDSYQAVDIEMSVGTDVVAAREGIVFDIASKNYRNGLDAQVDGPSANVVRILHDDGTYAIYAHLNTNSIRVQPGDFVERGQYIADSGNTGFSTGPHLHFAVVRNGGLRIDAVPITFRGPNSEAIVPESGETLIAY